MGIHSKENASNNLEMLLQLIFAALCEPPRSLRFPFSTGNIECATQ
jgi:hypothetical protein